MIGNRPVPIYI